MAKSKKATEPTETNNNQPTFVVESGPAPEPSKLDRKATGITAILKSLKVGDWFRVPRKDGKRDTSKFAGIVRIAKREGIGITSYPENEQIDIVKRVK